MFNSYDSCTSDDELYQVEYIDDEDTVDNSASSGDVDGGDNGGYVAEYVEEDFFDSCDAEFEDDPFDFDSNYRYKKSYADDKRTLEDMNISHIEKYLRDKKLQNIGNINNI